MNALLSHVGAVPLEVMRSTTPRRRGVAFALTACALLVGCASRAPVVPMAQQLDRSACPAQTDTLLVLLPGAYSDPAEFVREGYIDAVRERGLSVDVLRVDAHLGYYSNGVIIDRLRADVIAPAQAQGYGSIWIVGISIGGFGGMVYAEERPGELAGIVAIAPYLGERLIATGIDNAGGLARWRAPPVLPEMSPRERRELRVWRWLQAYSNEPPPSDHPPLWLGYGLDDRFAFSHRLLADALHADHVATTEGGHDWPEWMRLWRNLLPRLPLPRCR
ncbi:alpha/beta hydrolase [Variovorax rhizosphaerae]|uniref:Alpha/beta hydrolase n=1 Tax=Variovorax rhizosphaerae TaxID=1836200 RepID=A0ABU8WVB1_9BURK